jgi:hypothetical protein
LPTLRVDRSFISVTCGLLRVTRACLSIGSAQMATEAANSDSSARSIFFILFRKKVVSISIRKQKY